VRRSFDGVDAVQGVTLSIDRHEVVGLIGPNGAGKTTLINLVTGFDLPSEGKIAIGDDDVTTWQVRRRARAGLARTFQLGALGLGGRRAEARRTADELLAALELRSRADTLAEALSHGDQQKVGVARALASRPRYVLLDEPAAGLTESDVQAFAALVRRVRDEYEAGVLVVDHNMALILDVCDRVHVLDHGRTLAEGTPDEIRRNIDVTAAYLGSSGAEAQADD
jgi:branched-chain amino acid transport system ATP-binding protein